MRPGRKRELVDGCRGDWGVSIRRACRDVSEARRLKALEAENVKLKRMPADSSSTLAQ